MRAFTKFIGIPFALISPLLVLLIVVSVEAKKPDWPTGGGSGVIGFGLVDLTPTKAGDAYESTDFYFEYDIPAKFSGNVQTGQVIVLPASALEKYNDIPISAFKTFAVASNHLENSDFHMSVKTTISEPGRYVVAYGPFDGLLTFDDSNERDVYKISGRSKAGQLKWIDQDAGDFTVVNNENKTATSDKPAVYLRLRMLRDKGTLSMTAPLKIHPTALNRIKLIDANW